MLCILLPGQAPEFNLAAEEYLFRNFTDDLLLLYVNLPSVVVGKHQNAMAEVNPKFVAENNIKVIRRLSGGGAVYHDPGNLNFSFHQTVDDPARVSFKSFNEPIVEVLKQLGVPAEISARNDIFVNGFKVSGHAEHVFRKRILSHGTLLYDANREHLSKALKNNSGTFHGKAIQSVRSKVANIVDFMEHRLSLNDFIQHLLNFMLLTHPDNAVYQLSKKDIAAIEALVSEKYSQWEWNFGYSPKYVFEKEAGNSKVKVQVEKGYIVDLELSNDGLSGKQQNELVQSMLACPHEYQAINERLTAFLPNSPMVEQLMEVFF